ncbi:hypothetical protein GGI19_002467 [Coemansia pectinata]|uniref:DH domain-containing protein n=1 Tax=Coemansia pectinata TaxID=1052879 RepID=A0A9W8LC68_9FUNG|nr:hypothetical protein GGI19_002467 [Coemansia pectinata]
MAKSKLLTRTPGKQASTSTSSECGREVVAATAASASADLVRPRTAGGEKNILRRLRMGRLFFGLGFGSSPSPGSGFASASVEGASAGTGLNASTFHSSQLLLRTSSAHAPATTNDLLLLNSRGEHSPSVNSQALPYLSRQYADSYEPHNMDNRKSRYSVHSRRLSAPDGVDVSRGLSHISLASDLVPASHSSSDSLPGISIVVSSTSDSQRSEGIMRSAPSTQGPTASSSGSRLDIPIRAGSKDAAVSICHPVSLSTGSSSNRCSQSDASYMDSFNTASSGDVVAYQSLKSSASPLPPAHTHYSNDEFIPIPSNAPTPIITPATPQSSDYICASHHHPATSEPGDMTVQPRSPPPRSPAGRSRTPLGVERCVGGDAPLADGQYCDSIASSELLALHSNHAASGSSNNGRSQALSASLEAQRPLSGGRGLRQYIASDAASVHKQRWQQSPAFAIQSLSLPTSPATPSQRVSPLLLPGDESATQPCPNAPCCDSATVTTTADSGSSVILMGSVKQRGDKKTARQSGNADATRSVAPPPPAAPQVEPSSPEPHADAPRAQAASLELEFLPLPLTAPGDVPAASIQAADQSRTHVYNEHWVRSAPHNSRPKSLHERATHSKQSDYLATESELPPLRISSSIASAKAFLTMIAANQANGPAAGTPDVSKLTVVTSDAKGMFKYGSPGGSMHSPALASAPVAGTAGRFGSATEIVGITDSTSHALSAQDMAAAAEGAERDSPQSASPGVVGNRSLRVRSKLASVGIRRASTYVWSRSSVFMRGLASTDELSSCQHLPPTEITLDVTATATDTPTDPAQVPIDASSIEPRNSRSGSVEVGPTSAELDAAVRSSPVMPLISKSAPAVMRLHATRELVMTEKNFVDNLFVIKKVWMEPVFSSANSPKPIIPYQTARIIFFGIAALHSHASQFYREMDYILGSFERNQTGVEEDDDDGMRIGSLFRTSDRHWNDFIAYVRNYGTAVNCLKQLQEYKPYLRYHEECMAQKRTNRQSLKDLLMLPIQRITRYTLLLKNVLKHTPAVHSDHIELCRAVKNVTHFASIVNECRRKQEEMYRLIEIFRTIELCPALPHSDSRLFIAEFVVRELISRLPIRLLLFSDMIIVTQAPTHAKLDDAGQIDAVTAEWTYHGLAFLDRVEVQNADESTNTLITILSLNRGATATDTQGDCRRSLPSADEPANMTCAPGPCDFGSSSSQNSLSEKSEVAEPFNRVSASRYGSGPGPGTSTHRHNVKTMSEIGPVELSSRRKKMRSRKGILRVNSRDSIPDHIAALSRSTFPSPVPSPALLERSSSRLNCSSYIAPDTVVDRDRDTTYATPQHRPKTASGSSGTSFSSSSQPSSTLHSSNATLAGYANPMLTEPGVPYRPLPSDVTLGGPVVGAVPYMSGRADLAPPKTVQLTLVMQHATSAARKQFVRALKDATAKHAHELEAAATAALDVNSDFSAADSGCDVLNLHPL